MEQQKIKLEDIYKPSEKVMERITDVYTDYLNWRSFKTQPYRQFNNQTLNDYMIEARQKFWGYLPLSDDVDTPQFFFPETRNQIISLLARMAGLRAKASFEGVENFDIVKATLLNDLFTFWRRNSNRRLQDFWQYMYNVINGTVVVFTAFKNNKRDVKNVTFFDEQTGETRYTIDKLDESDVEDKIVNLEDLFIPKIQEPGIQEQRKLIWRSIMKFDEFKDEYKKYKNVDLVMPGSQFPDESIFAQFIPYNIRVNDYVEIIRYYDTIRDEYMILANGVLMNSIMVDGKEEIAPMPWNHKKLPFSKTIFEPLDANFFFGMPLAQKVKSPQDALNKMWELLLEREIRAINRPIITNDPSIELGLEFKPGRVYQVQGDPNSYKEIDMASASNSYWNALTALDGVIQNTGSGSMMPIQPSVQPRSARENMNNAAQQQQVTGIYNIFYQDLLEQKAWLTIKNMIQFYTAEMVSDIIGERKFNKILSLTDTILRGGGIGNREIRITNSPLPAAKLQEESYMRSLLNKERVEIIEVTPQALRSLRFDIKMSFEQENSPETERALFLDYVTTMFNLFGQQGIISPKKAFFRISEKFNENPSDLVDDTILSEYENERFFGIAPNQPQNPQQQGQPQGQQGQQPSESQMPTVAQARNSRRGMMFGAQGPAQQMQNTSNK